MAGSAFRATRPGPGLRWGNSTATGQAPNMAAPPLCLAATVASGTPAHRLSSGHAGEPECR